MRILIAEKEQYLSEMIAVLLKRAGYATDVVYDGTSCMEWVRSGIYDALILDAVLPQMDGFAVLSALRARNNAIPILMLTEQDMFSDRVRGLNKGVDYCLGKPFAGAELLACLAAILRRRAVFVPDTLEAFDLTLCPSDSELRCGEQYILLNAKEIAIMRLLIRNRNQILPKETILVKIWGYDAMITDNNVEVYVSFLRKKLTKVRSKARIVTYRSLGYRLEEV